MMHMCISHGTHCIDQQGKPALKFRSLQKIHMNQSIYINMCVYKKKSIQVY